MAGTCATGATSMESCGGGEIMLFGVRVVVDSMRKSVSMGNLSQYALPDQDLVKSENKNNVVNNNNSKEDVIAGYASADDAVPNSSGANRERKRGIPWTEDEHKLFLLGLQRVGKGDWRGISRNFVKTRTPTQVASHAQKYFLRRSNLNRRRRRSSLFDITTDTVTAVSMDEEPIQQSDRASQSPQPPSQTKNANGFHMIPDFPMNVNSVASPVPIENPMEKTRQINQASSAKPIRPIPVAPKPTKTTDLNLNLDLDLNSNVNPSTLSLKLALSSVPSAFQVMSSFTNGDSSNIISVA